MAVAPSVRGIKAEGLPADVRKVLDYLANPLNDFMEPVTDALNNGLTLGENFNAQISTFTVAVPSDWTAVTTFTFGWTNFNSATNPVAQYRKTPDGMVEVMGVIKSGVVASAAFTLPIGYRPTLPVNFAVYSNGAFGYVTVDSTGTVTLGAGSNVSVDFGLMRFAASDRSPIPCSCWPQVVALDVTGKPQFVLATVADVRDDHRARASYPIDWEYYEKENRRFVRVKNIPGLEGGRSYRVTLGILGE